MILKPSEFPDQNQDHKLSPVLKKGQDLRVLLPDVVVNLLLIHYVINLGGILFEKLPKLWDSLTEALVISPSDGTETSASLNSSGIVLQHGEPQPLINNLQVNINKLFLDKRLQSRVIKLLLAIFGCVRNRQAAVRLTAARCITAMSKAWRQPLIAAVLEKVVPMLDDSSSVEARQGVSMLLMFLVEGLGADLVPYAPFLIVPLLGCMSDTDAIVRQTVIHSFAALVPLAKGVDPPPGLNKSLLSRSAGDARFLEQLLDNSRVDDYKLEVVIHLPSMKVGNIVCWKPGKKTFM